MNPNVRKGLKRVAVVYFTLCALAGLYGWYLYDTSQSGWLEASRVNASPPEIRYWSQLFELAVNWLAGAFVFGIVVPVVAAIVGGVSYWIFRGFRPKAQA